MACAIVSQITYFQFRIMTQTTLYELHPTAATKRYIPCHAKELNISISTDAKRN